jgi:ornithine carbamoyltransferase
VPVINGLTNEYHPCQILADIYTFIEQRGPIQGKTVAWVGDSNNMCNTWLQAAEVLDFNVHVSTPPGYEVEPERAGLFSTTITKNSLTRWMPVEAPIWSPPMSGPAWGSRLKTPSA